MTSRLAPWQYILFICVIIISSIYALPNLYGEDPCIQITLKRSIATQKDQVLKDNFLDDIKIKSTLDLIRNDLTKHKIKFKKIKFHSKDGILIHLSDSEKQLLAKEVIESLLGRSYSVTLNLVTAMPEWLNYFGAKPMKLGLDLRGGIRFLMEVDCSPGIRSGEDSVKLNEPNLTTLKNSIMERTVQTLRNRVNELGVGEAVVQRQSDHYIVIELPGLQDPARAKDILGKTATLNFVMVDDTGILSPATRWVKDRQGRDILVQRKKVLTGDSIIWANAAVDSRENKAMVSLRLVDNHKINLFKRTTRENIGKAMAIIYQENKLSDKNSSKPNVAETIISIATIQSPLEDHFQITGLNLAESRDLALLLRSGAMPAPVSIVEEKIIGPSLGQENIKSGVMSVILGLSLVLIVMVGYYSLFGAIANLTLLFNLILLIAGMSIIEATLTLPGIAGIVLTLGMAVDSNVLIFERIREELKSGCSNLVSIQRGFEGALATIVDSNLTTLIVGIILFSIGTGPIKGFAIVLSIGILTSLFTAITGTRALVSLLYEGKYHLNKIWVGL